MKHVINALSKHFRGIVEKNEIVSLYFSLYLTKGYEVEQSCFSHNLFIRYLDFLAEMKEITTYNLATCVLSIWSCTLNSSYLYQGIDGIYKYEDPYDESLAKLL